MATERMYQAALKERDGLAAELARVTGQRADLVGALRAALLDTDSQPCDAIAKVPNTDCGCWRCNARSAIKRTGVR